MKRWVSGLLLAALGAVSAFAQSAGGRVAVSGTVVDGADKSPIIQAGVQILSVKDSSAVAGNVTDIDGNFRVSARPGKYLLKISYIGYKPDFRTVVLNAGRPRLNVGTIQLDIDAIMLGEAVVVAEAPEVIAKEDTLVYNSSAYRVPEGSALEELVKKLPGAEVDENGKITINGKEITKIMIDGKEFFADDPNIAMKNLPVNIIDKVQAYDKQSDMAKMTGIDDGEEETVLDLSVKPGMNKGWFGNVDVAAGTKDRYSGKLMLNRFVGDNQFTVIGSANNVNDNGFPGGGGGFRRGNQNGLNAVKMAGFNFAAETETLESGGSVNFNYRDADIRSKQNSETFVSSQTSSFKNALDASRNKSTNLTADFRLEWKPDTLTWLMFRPRITYGKTDNGSSSNSFTFNEDPGLTSDELVEAEDITSLVSQEKIINTIARNTLSRSDNFSAQGMLLVNRRLGKAGRNITMRARYNYTNNDSEQLSASQTDYYQTAEEVLASGAMSEILNRYMTTPTRTSDYSVRLSYSEPIFKGGFLQFSYDFQYKNSKTENSTFDMPEAWGVEQGFLADEAALNADLSKNAEYNYYNHRTEVQLRLIRNKMRFNVGASFQPQRSTLSYTKGNYSVDTVRTVFNFTPTLDFRYNFSKTSQLRVNYRGRSSQPSMTDLLPITDDTDPLNVTIGNTHLKDETTYYVDWFVSLTNPQAQSGHEVGIKYQLRTDAFSMGYTYNPNTGVRTYRMGNVNGNWYGRLNYSFYTPLDKAKRLNVKTVTSAEYANSVDLLGESDTETFSASRSSVRTLTLKEDLNLDYKIGNSQIGLKGSYAWRRINGGSANFQDFSAMDFNYGATALLNLPWHFQLSTDLMMYSRRGYTGSSMNTNDLVWNARLSYTAMKGKLTFMLDAFDILNQINNVTRVVNAQGRTETFTNALPRYALLHVAYKFNIMPKKK